MLNSISDNAYIKEEAKNGVLKVYGSIFSKIPDVIKDTLDYMANNKDIEKIELVGLNGVDLSIDKKTTFESAMQDLDKKQEELSKKQQEEREAWLKSPEGQAHIEREKQEKAEHDAFVYHEVEEPLLALTNIKPCLLSSDKTLQAEALEFCQEIMTIILKCEELNFDEEQAKMFSDILKDLGATKTKEASFKFLSYAGHSIETLMNTKGNIEFPLSAFDQLIDAKDASTFNFGLSLLTEGGMKNSWIGKWLNAQKEKEKTLDDPN